MRHSTSLHRALGHGPGEPPRRPRARTDASRPEHPPSRRDLAWARTAAGSGTAAGGTALLLAGTGAARGPLLVLVPAVVLALPWLRHRRRPAATGAGQVAGSVVGVGERAVAGSVVGVGERAVAVLVALLLLPVIVLIAAALKVTDRGPALVREVHRDRDGRVVLSSRFRTGPGAFLRRSGLDELPRVLDAARGGGAVPPAAARLNRLNRTRRSWRRATERRRRGSAAPVPEARLPLALSAAPARSTLAFRQHAPVLHRRTLMRIGRPHGVGVDRGLGVGGARPSPRLPDRVVPASVRRARAARPPGAPAPGGTGGPPPPPVAAPPRGAPTLRSAGEPAAVGRAPQALAAAPPPLIR